MISKTVRTSLAGAAVAALFLAVPAESHAIFNWLSRCCGGGAAAPTYGAAPLFGAAATADPCCAPPQVSQTVNYVPQTCYRTQYVTVPVTTYRPVVGRDPCSGCPVTCMRPATSYIRQARLTPYTTYRAVVSNACCGSSGVMAAASYAPSLAPGAASCSGCSAATPLTYAAPAAAPYYANPVPAAISGSANGAASMAPTLAPAPASSGPSPTFAPMQKTEKPIPDTKDEPPADDASSERGAASGTGTILSPRLITPGDRTTSYPILRAGVHRPVSYNEPAPLPRPMPAPRRLIDDGGWRPSTR